MYLLLRQLGLSSSEIMPIIIILFGMGAALNIIGIPAIALGAGILKVTISGILKLLVYPIKGIGWLCRKIFEGVRDGLPAKVPKWLRPIIAGFVVLVFIAIIII